MTCKANCAAYVSINTPQMANRQTIRRLMLCTRGTDRCNTRFLDASHQCGIIMIAIGMPILGDCGARQERQQASEDPGPPRRGYVEPGTREGPRSEISRPTEEYGVSRPTYYQTKASFDEAGIAGLVPKKRGPRGPHKLQGAVLAFVQQQLVAGEPIRARELAKLIRQKFGLDVHPRTIERAVTVKKTPR